MWTRFFLFVCILSAVHVQQVKKPTVLISILARNKAHTLPYFLGCLEKLEYPKNRIALWISSDHNDDQTIEILRKWVKTVKNDYHLIRTNFEKHSAPYREEIGPAHWTPERFSHVINLRESSLNFAREIWADYYWTLDCDVFLTNPNTLSELMSKNVTIVGPLLMSENLYSNFWHGMSDDFYYERTEEYRKIVERSISGCFQVPMVHSCVLVDLRKADSDLLTYDPRKVEDYKGPWDDIITFAVNANKSKIQQYVCNDMVGFLMVPLEETDGLEVDLERLTNIKLEVLVYYEPLQASTILESYTQKPQERAKDTLGFDKIFMINLKRRPERRKRMKWCFDELGMDAKVVDAVDWKTLNSSVLKNISPLPEFADPFHNRSMTFGEIGCFLSHYNIWKEVVAKGYETTLVLEDDVRFEPYFRRRLHDVMNDVKRIPDWDLVYLGRKPLQEDTKIEGSDLLTKAGYSYWTLAYVLSLNGARKLLNADPLSRLLPVDEYFPILFDRHPSKVWKKHFPRRDLVALSAAPLLAYPTHYMGQQGYISDTEASHTIDHTSNNKACKTPRDDL